MHILLVGVPNTHIYYSCEPSHSALRFHGSIVCVDCPRKTTEVGTYYYYDINVVTTSTVINTFCGKEKRIRCPGETVRVFDEFLCRNYLHVYSKPLTPYENYRS